MRRCSNITFAELSKIMVRLNYPLLGYDMFLIKFVNLKCVVVAVEYLYIFSQASACCTACCTSVDAPTSSGMNHFRIRNIFNGLGTVEVMGPVKILPKRNWKIYDFFLEFLQCFFLPSLFLTLFEVWVPKRKKLWQQSWTLPKDNAEILTSRNNIHRCCAITHFETSRFWETPVGRYRGEWCRSENTNALKLTVCAPDEFGQGIPSADGSPLDVGIFVNPVKKTTHEEGYD